MLNFRRNLARIDSASARIADVIVAGIPAGTPHLHSARAMPGRAARTVREAAGHAADFARDPAAGLVARTYLLWRLKLRLADAGYPSDSIDAVTGGLAMAMQQARDRAAGASRPRTPAR